MERKIITKTEYLKAITGKKGFPPVYDETLRTELERKASIIAEKINQLELVKIPLEVTDAGLITRSGSVFKVPDFQALRPLLELKDLPRPKKNHDPFGDY